MAWNEKTRRRQSSDAAKVGNVLTTSSENITGVKTERAFDEPQRPPHVRFEALPNKENPGQPRLLRQRILVLSLDISKFQSHIVRFEALPNKENPCVLVGTSSELNRECNERTNISPDLKPKVP